jgi:hypothetical protein
MVIEQRIQILQKFVNLKCFQQWDYGEYFTARREAAVSYHY